MPRETEARKIANLLYLKLRQSERSMRDISRDLDWPQDRLSRLLKGTSKLDFDDVYEVLSVLNIPPSHFWEELYGPGRRPSVLWELDLGPSPDPDKPIPGGLTWGQLMTTVRQVLAEELAKREERAKAAKEAEEKAQEEPPSADPSNAVEDVGPKEVSAPVPDAAPKTKRAPRSRRSRAGESSSPAGDDSDGKTDRS